MSEGERVVLVVEGNPSLAHTLLDALKEVCPGEVVLTHDRAGALDYLLGRSTHTGRGNDVLPCVILLDLSLPDVDGSELLRELRTHEGTKLLPIVAFSFSEQKQEVNAIYASGANSYIGQRAGVEPFVEVLRHVARYWCVLNEPPPPMVA
jgi:two-component system, response regulator